MIISTKGKKVLGTGAFSKVWDNNDGTVLIRSICYQKEAFSNGWGNSGDLFPKLEYVDSDDFGNRFYTMKKYNKVKGIKSNVNTHQWEFYCWLRRVHGSFYSTSIYDGYSLLYSMFDNMPVQFSYESEQLISCIDALSNYGTDIAFEISPRNVCINDGKLILLDCFFFRKQLEELISSRCA